MTTNEVSEQTHVQAEPQTLSGIWFSDATVGPDAFERVPCPWCVEKVAYIRFFVTGQPIVMCDDCGKESYITGVQLGPDKE